MFITAPSRTLLLTKLRNTIGDNASLLPCNLVLHRFIGLNSGGDQSFQLKSFVLVELMHKIFTLDLKISFLQDIEYTE